MANLVLPLPFLMHSDLEATLITIEQSLHDPAIRASSVQAGALLSADFREFGASGRVWSRVEVLAELAGETSQVLVSDNFACLRLSPALALLTYVCRSPAGATLRSSLWRLEDDRWRVLFHQGTIIPAEERV